LVFVVSTISNDQFELFLCLFTPFYLYLLHLTFDAAFEACEADNAVEKEFVGMIDRLNLKLFREYALSVIGN